MTATGLPVDEAEALVARLTSSGSRAIVPSEREVAAGAPRPLYPPGRAEHEEGTARPSVGAAVVAALRQADPRAIAGPKRPLVSLGLVSMVLGWYAGSFLLVLPDMSTDFTFDTAFLVVLFSTGVVVGDVCGPFIGWLSDRIARVHLYRASTVVFVLAMGRLVTAGGVNDILVALVLASVAAFLPLPAQVPLLADYFPPESRIKVLSFLGAASIGGSVAGQVVGGFVIEGQGWRGLVAITLALAVVAVVATSLLREPERGAADGVHVDEAPPRFFETYRAVRSIVTVRRLWYASLFWPAGATGFAFSAITLTDRGMAPRAQGAAIAVAGAFTFVALPVVGGVVERAQAGRPSRLLVVMGATFFAQAVFLVVEALSPWLWLSILVLVPLQFAVYAVLTMVGAIYSLVIPARIRGLGAQSGKPFELASRLLTLLWVAVGGLFAAFAATPRGGTILVLAVPAALAGVLVLGATPSIARDIRAAAAVVSAEEEAKRARELGRSKMLVCRQVEVAYDGVQVLFGVDLDVEEGEIVALLGTNGAGKSTLLRAITGVQEASNGAIFLDGVDITHEPPHLNAARGVVMVPGGHAIFPTLTVAENIRAAAWLYQEDDAYVTERTEEVLDLFPILRERLDETAGSLSGGEQQMLAIGQAFLMKPRLLMIDELSLGLAPAVVEQLLATLRVVHEQGTTIILIEQSINVAMTIARRAVFMEKGEVRYDGPTEDLMARPELVRAVFMGGATGGGPAARPTRAGDRRAREPQLVVDGVSVRFGGVTALQGASLVVGDGEVVGIIGPNGAGKTTLFDVISGFVAPDEGRVLLDGGDVTSLSPELRAAAGLGRSFQSARLFPSLTVAENIAVAMDRRITARNPLAAAVWMPKVRRNERLVTRRVDALIEILGLQAYTDKFVDELSTGTRRAVDIACIMASQPKTLLLDEPSSGLAQAETEELGPVLEGVARETGCGMLVIEHDIGLVSSISHRLYAMELGAVVTSGPPGDVVADRRVLTSYLAATEDVVARSGLARAVLGEPDAHDDGTGAG